MDLTVHLIHYVLVYCSTEWQPIALLIIQHYALTEIRNKTVFSPQEINPSLFTRHP